MFNVGKRELNNATRTIRDAAASAQLAEIVMVCAYEKIREPIRGTGNNDRFSLERISYKRKIAIKLEE